MNNKRRARLQKVLHWLDAAESDLESVLEDEQNSFDNLPDGLQSSARGSLIEEAVDCLTDAIDSVQEAIGYVNDAIEK